MVLSHAARRIMSFCLAFLLTVSCLPFCFTAVFAEEEGGAFYAVASSTALSTDGKTLIENYSEEIYYPFGAADEVRASTFRGRPAIVSSPRETNDGAFYLAYAEPKDLSAYNELYFQLRIEGTGGKCDVQMTFSSGGETYDVRGSFEPGISYDVYCPVSSFGARSAVDHVYFYYSSNENIGFVTVSSIYADAKFTYSHAERFSADAFTIDSENVISEKSITIEPSAGACSLEAKRRGASGSSGTVISRVSVSGVETGTMTLLVKDQKASDYSDISTIYLFPGKNSYTFIYDVSAGNGFYKLSFSGTECTDGKSLSVDSVSFTYFDEKIDDSKETYPASISSCSLSSDGKSVNVKGTVGSGFVVNNIDGKIGIVAEDMWRSHDPVVVASADMSTMFDMKIAVSSLPALPYLCRFGVVLLSGDEGEFERESQSVYPSFPTGAVVGAPSIFGIESDDTSAPFECAASYTVCDVDVERLVTDDPASGRFFSYAGNYYYLNTSYLSELERTLGFYLSSGVKVYVRIVSSGGAEDEFECPDAYDVPTVMRYAAAVDYITETYPSVYGIIAGCRINTFRYNRTDKEDLFLYAENYAEYLRVVASAAKSNNPSCLVAVPFGDGYLYGGDGRVAEYDSITGIGDETCDPIMLSVLISKFLSEGGGVQWYMMYECESAPMEKAELLSRAVSRLSQNVGSAPAGHVLYWRPDGELTEEDLASLDGGTPLTTLGTKSFIISLKGGAASAETLAALKYFDPDSTRAYDIVTANALPSYDAPQTGRVFIKDFRRSYGAGDFFSGGTVSSLTTEKSEVMSRFEGQGGERALRAAGDGSLGGEGIIMANFATPVPFTAADTLDVALCVTGEGESIPVKIVAGNGADRCEYRYSASPGVPVLLKCRISESGLDAASYVAIEVACSSEYTVDVSGISLSRDDGDEDAVRDSIGGDGGVKKDNGATVTALIATGAATLAVFALLSIKGDRKDDGAKEASKETAAARKGPRKFK